MNLAIDRTPGARGRKTKQPIENSPFNNLSEEQSRRFSAIIANAPVPPNLGLLVERSRKMPPSKVQTHSASPTSKKIYEVSLASDVSTKVKQSIGAQNILDARVRESSLVTASSRQGQYSELRKLAGGEVSALPENYLEAESGSQPNPDKRLRFRSSRMGKDEAPNH